MPAGVYFRLGSTSRPASPELLTELQRSLTNTSFDQEPVYDASIEDLEFDAVQAALENQGKSLNESKLLTLGVLVRSSAGLVPSVGGVTLFGTQKVRERLVPDARVSCARFEGDSSVAFLDRYEVDGSILAAIDQVPKFIARNTRLSAEIKAMQRRDIPEYPVVAIREALVNALVHSDYYLLGSRIHVAIYSDRLEVQNPGTFPFGYTLQDFRNGLSKVRNRVIARVFRELGYVEEWGTGYKRIHECCQMEGYPEPCWEEFSSTMRVTFFPHAAATGVGAPSAVTGTSREREESILILLRARGFVQASEIFEAFDRRVPLRTLRHDLSRLRDRGLVSVQGHGRGAVWCLARKAKLKRGGGTT